MSMSMVHGPVPLVVAGFGLLGMAWLLAGRGRLHWLRRLPAAVVVAATVTATLVFMVDRVWRPFPDALPRVVVLYLAAALVAATLVVVRWPSVHRWQRWVLLPLAGVAVLVAAAAGVNLFYRQYPTLGTVLGTPLPHQVTLGRVNAPAAVVTAPPRRPLSAVWRAPADLTAQGSVTVVDIPAVRSGFHARPAMVYLPPAYLTVPRARLPVLVLLAGQPGSPRDWFDGGRLAQRMDRFAAAHDGLAPVVVVPDVLGSALANPLCLDSRLGNAATYLDADVPAWIRATLQVDPDPRAWAVGGLSSGGTCALQAAVRSAQVYPTLLDISGQTGPTLGSRAATVQAAYGGDEAAFRAVDPLAVLVTRRLPGSAAMLAVGDRDAIYGPQQGQVALALRRAGVSVHTERLRGGHSWAVWGPAVDRTLPWLAARLGLT